MTSHLSPLGVFVAEDSRAVRDRLIERLHENDLLAVVGQAASAQGAVDGILSSVPDCVLLDFHLDGGTAVDVLRAVRPQVESATVIVLTNYAYPQYRRLCAQLGANWFLDKSAHFDFVCELLAGLAVGNQQPSESSQLRIDHAHG